MKRQGRWLALLLLPLVAGCGKPHPVDAHPALWRVADRDTTIWLFGSIHALPSSVRWETPVVQQAIAAADTLILEVLPTNPAIAHDAFLRVAAAPGLAPLLDRVPPADRGLVARGMAAAGQAPAALDGFKTWAAALTISAKAGHLQDADAADGVEAVLAQQFAGKRIGALETASGQFAMFDRLPPDAQRLLLMQAATEALDSAHAGAAVLRAWAAGDEAALAESVTPLRRDKAIDRTLLTDRNARWAAAIVHRMARPGRMFVAVGAGHLVGPGSVVALLRARGWRVARVE